jgi:hypothetical protein
VPALISWQWAEARRAYASTRAAQPSVSRES